MSELRFQTLSGHDAEPFINDLAALRIKVFYDFPYLYDGTMEYEQNYLARYMRCPGSIVVLCFDGPTAIGAATGMPLAEEDPVFTTPFTAVGYNLRDVFYCGESVLLPQYRGRGVGKEFFRYREQHARNSITYQFKYSSFCAVVRNPDHPLKPLNYMPHDIFWNKQGYRIADGLTTQLGWQDRNEKDETEKTMQFWIKAL